MMALLCSSLSDTDGLFLASVARFHVPGITPLCTSSYSISVHVYPAHRVVSEVV